MEARRLESGLEGQWKGLERGWCLGPAEFKAALLERMAGKLGEHHSGRLRRESAEAKGERIIGEELKRRKWRPGELGQRRKNDPGKLEVALRLRRETTLTIRQIAQRLHMGSWKSLNNKLYLAAKANAGSNRTRYENA